jgi:hypothetical protein
LVSSWAPSVSPRNQPAYSSQECFSRNAFSSEAGVDQLAGVLDARLVD